ncbi:hypothetical protein [Chlamydia suis]|uniref:Inclusion membrane protein-49 n=1 Tax=Chlamydia suis TaxID=83559 RepID=A0AAQ0EN08_9CHLA|nr:hypothetical protein [Chlamydia suis]MEB2681199.1 hypothetical protein [Chlamydia suis]MEB2681931.1 hypothetical protein [Chlamydia suis]MEB2682853.1 hypothetical protein [Chlamydia suis]MEB2683906.1 hypothetical protein [Chlamydia suis]MEB2684666.1 hypothetical protein [Chlamydia suis]
MFGSIPCYPGCKKVSMHDKHYYYCSLCDSIVSPTSVDVAVVSPNLPAAHPKFKLSVLRCKNHPTKGLSPGGPITSLQGLAPSSSTPLTETYQEMLRLCSRVRCLDILTLCSTLIAALLAITGTIIQFVIAAPTAFFIPFILLGLAIVLCIGAFSCARISQKSTSHWQRLSQKIVLSSVRVPVQSGTECYTLLTEFPPTCYETPKPVNSAPGSRNQDFWNTPRFVAKKTACKLSARTLKILKNRRKD